MLPEKWQPFPLSLNVLTNRARVTCIPDKKINPPFLNFFLDIEATMRTPMISLV